MEYLEITTDQLRIGLRAEGPVDGWPCFLMHGFPYDVHAYDAVVPELVRHGARVFVPWLRGYGPTKFLHADTPRSGEQAALGHDLLQLMDVLSIKQATLAGYDWGGRACCIVSALWPERVEALVTENGYNIQNIARAMEPELPAHEARYWYQYYFHSERGRRGLESDRRGISRLLWKMWSPTWNFDDATFLRSANAFDNADFVNIVIHSYRHRYGLEPGDQALASIETKLALQPSISVPAIAIDGDRDGVSGGISDHSLHFTGPFEHRIFKNGGHNLPQEMPVEWAKAVLDARSVASL